MPADPIEVVRLLLRDEIPEQELEKIVSRSMPFPVSRFVAAVNTNRVFADYLGTGKFVLGTAHPAKFLDAYPPSLRDAIQVPPSLSDAMERRKQSIRLGNSLEELSSFLRQF